MADQNGVLGRDGVLNIFRDDHVKAPEEWAPIPGALDAVARLNHAGWHAVVATNQSGIGRGLVDMTSLNAIHQHMMQVLAAKGGRIDAVFPEAKHCRHCSGCDRACPKGIEVQRMVNLASAGQAAGAARVLHRQVCSLLRALLRALLRVHAPSCGCGRLRRGLRGRRRR